MKQQKAECGIKTITTVVVSGEDGVCVCVCVCVRERERERERGLGRLFTSWAKQ